MTQATVAGLESPRREESPHLLAVVAGMAGLAASLAWLWAFRPLQFQIVKYEIISQPSATHLPSNIFALAVLFIPVVVAIAAARRGPSRLRWARALGVLWPMVLSLPLAAHTFSGRTPPFFFSLLFIAGCGGAAYLAGSRMASGKSSSASAIGTARPIADPGDAGRWHSALAIGSLLVLILLLTIIHTRIQINFFEHFMMGHADVGHYAEELKNALAGRGLRCDSFPNTRLGWHFVPLMYVLVPLYALWPTPVLLMALGAIIVHLPAIPAYVLARRRSGSALVGWMGGVAWLLIPSASRLVYSNTYGFEWVYVALPLLGILFAASALGRWKTAWAMIVLLLLCMETNASATFGFGLYLTCFTQRRRAGLVVMGISIVYVALCTQFIIPHFAAAGRYERLDLFGELGHSLGSLAASAFTQPAEFWGRLVRPQGLWLLAMLMTTLFFLPLRGWRLSLAVLPTLIPIFLLQNADWLSIKFWHHATVLPFLFFAGLGASVDHATPPIRPVRPMGAALAVLIGAAWGHYFFGFSPLSKSYEPYAGDVLLQNPDPRFAFVTKLRSELPRDRTILATERLAAHFTDFKRLYTGGRPQSVDFIVIDRSDAWDTSGLPQRAAEFAAHPDYRLRSQSGPMVVFERKADAPPLLLEEN